METVDQKLRGSVDLDYADHSTSLYRSGSCFKVIGTKNVSDKNLL